jgi:tRNA wybutosine-synthesizing protein 4
MFPIHQEPIITFRETDFKNTPTAARFGASVIHHQGQIYLIGGVLKDQILSLGYEICILDFQNCLISPVSLKQPSNIPRPLLIGVSVADTGQSFVIMGGSAVCFSFGTFWNKGCYTMSMLGINGAHGNSASVKQVPIIPWRFMRSVAAVQPVKSTREPHPTSTTDQPPVIVPRVQVASSEHFNRLLQAAQPVILEKLDIGSCSSKWTTEYLKERVGSEREVNISNLISPLLLYPHADPVGNCPRI